jgi:GntR family transcriptional repressor for pyruvate dehydrogenase complex
MALTIKKQRVSHAVAESLLELIRQQTYAPGSRLPPEKDLCAMFGISRHALREGLKELEALGIISVKHGEGIFVKRISVESMLETLLPLSQLVELDQKDLLSVVKVRRVIELETAQEAAQSITPPQLERLAGLLQQMEEALDDPRQFGEADVEFHVALAEASGNSIASAVLRLLRSMYAWMFQSRRALPPQRYAQSLAQHKAIYAALSAGDARAARKAMAEHLELVRRNVLTAFGPADTGARSRASRPEVTEGGEEEWQAATVRAEDRCLE